MLAAIQSKPSRTMYGRKFQMFFPFLSLWNHHTTTVIITRTRIFPNQIMTQIRGWWFNVVDLDSHEVVDSNHNVQYRPRFLISTTWIGVITTCRKFPPRPLTKKKNYKFNENWAKFKLELWRILEMLLFLIRATFQ